MGTIELPSDRKAYFGAETRTVIGEQQRNYETRISTSGGARFTRKPSL